jgi:hypothetical protein
MFRVGRAVQTREVRSIPRRYGVQIVCVRVQWRPGCLSVHRGRAEEEEDAPRERRFAPAEGCHAKKKKKKNIKKK